MYKCSIETRIRTTHIQYILHISTLILIRHSASVSFRPFLEHEPGRADHTAVLVLSRDIECTSRIHRQSTRCKITSHGTIIRGLQDKNPLLKLIVLWGFPSEKIGILICQFISAV